MTALWINGGVTTLNNGQCFYHPDKIFIFVFRLVEEVKEKCAVIIEAEEVYMNTR